MYLKRKYFRILRHNILMMESHKATEAFPIGVGKACRVGNELNATHWSKEQALRESLFGGQWSPLAHP